MLVTVKVAGRAASSPKMRSVLMTCVVMLFGVVIFALSDSCRARSIQLCSDRLQMFVEPTIFKPMSLRGGTDWSDDSAGVVRARLKMKKPERNETETTNSTASKNADAHVPMDEE